MMKISLQDIKKRVCNLNESYSLNKSTYGEYIHEQALRDFTSNSIAESMKLYRNKFFNDTKNESIIFEKMLDLYETIQENCGSNSSEVDIAKHYINEVTDRVRTPKEMISLLKRRITLGTKTRGTTKFNNKIKDNKTIEAGSSVNKNIKDNVNTLSTKMPVANIPVATIATPASKSSSSSSKEDDSVSEGYYKELINKCEISAEADRVLNNYDKLSKRFNIDRVMDSIEHNTPASIGSVDIDSFCDLFDTWSDKEMSKKSKFNVAIETALYVNSKHNNPIDRSILIESIVDYHLFKGLPFDTIYNYLQENSMIDNNDLIIYNHYYNRLHNINNAKDINSILEAESTNPDKNVAEEIEEFKKSNKAKDPKEFQHVIEKAYTKNPDQIVNNAPKFFDVFRFFSIMSAFAINPIFGLVKVFTDQFLKRKFSREETNKMITKYEKEIDKLGKKIEKCENEKKKQSLKEYKRSMENNLYKLQDYERELYTDEEQEAKEAERDAKRDYGSSDEYNWDFGEAVSLIDMSEYVMNMDKDKIKACIETHIDKIVHIGFIDEVTEFVRRTEGFIPIEQIKSIYENYYYQLKNNTSKKDYLAIDIIKSNINKLDEGYIDSDNLDSINFIEGCYLFNEALKMIDYESPVFLEVSFKNTFNIVKTKVQNAIKTMSDKEKQLSSQIDIAVAGFQNDVGEFFKSNSREAVLRGRVLPKASKILKIGLAFGLTSWLVHPLVAVIGVLGYIGVSSICKNKERQIILDEIDVELEMVEKYIQAAEQKDDLKAVKNLLMTKKRLQKERLRIKYKMKMNGERPDPNDLK